MPVIIGKDGSSKIASGLDNPVAPVHIVSGGGPGSGIRLYDTSQVAGNVSGAGVDIYHQAGNAVNPGLFIRAASGGSFIQNNGTQICLISSREEGPLTNLYDNNNPTTPSLQQFSTAANGSAFSITRSIGSPRLFLSRGEGAGVAKGENLGAILWNGYDGTNYRTAAKIYTEVDGDPSSAAMPGRIVFDTRASGEGTTIEKFRIANNGVLFHNQPAPTTKSGAATLTIAEMQKGIIQYTGAAATLTLPTGTNAEDGTLGPYTNISFYWSVINTGSGTCTIAANTNHTIVGSATIAAGASGRYLTRRSTTNFYISYRIS